MHSDPTTPIVQIPIVKMVGGSPGHKHTRQYEEIAAATVDAIDEEYLRQFTWLLCIKKTETRYAQRAVFQDGATLTVYMHREIWERHHGSIPDGFTPDHKNRNGLDNRLENLRLATPAQQGFNKGPINSSTGYKGVSFNTRMGKYRASIRCHPERLFLGWFTTAREAAIAYNKAALNLHGEFAYLNPIDDSDGNA